MFENYTNVGQFQRVISDSYISNNLNLLSSGSNSEILDLWVGNYIGYGSGAFGTNQYFDNKTGIIRGNILIQEPNFITEIRWFDNVWDEYNNDCFELPSYCN